MRAHVGLLRGGRILGHHDPGGNAPQCRGERERCAVIAGGVRDHASPRDFLGQEPYVVGHITMDEGVLMPAPVVGVAPEDVEVGTRVKATLRRMKLGHEGDIYYSQKFVVDEPAPEGAPS